MARSRGRRRARAAWIARHAAAAPQARRSAGQRLSASRSIQESSSSEGPARRSERACQPVHYECFTAPAQPHTEPVRERPRRFSFAEERSGPSDLLRLSVTIANPMLERVAIHGHGAPPVTSRAFVHRVFCLISWA